MVTFNDMPHIQRCVESVYDQVDRVLAIDGRFADFPDADDFSTDGTLAYLDSLDKATVHVAFGISEVDKRNLYLDGEEGDWYLHLDTDEVWSGLQIRIPNAHAGLIENRRDSDGRYYDRLRLFRHVEGLHYEGLHYRLRDGQGQIFAELDTMGPGYTAERIKGRIIHHNKQRGPIREQRKAEYYSILTKHEHEIRENS